MQPIKLFTPSFAYYGRVIQLMLSFKEVAYEITDAPFGTKLNWFSEEHQQLHPFKKLPVLIDGDFVLTESIAMAHYIDSFDGKPIMPISTKDKAHCIAIASHMNSDVHKNLLANLILEVVFPKGEDNQIRFDHINANLSGAKNALAWIESLLANNTTSEAPYIVGNTYTIADAYLLPAIDYVDQLPEPYNLVQYFPLTFQYLKYHREQPLCATILGPAEINLG